MTERLHFPFSLSCIGEGMATHSSVLAWRISGTGEPGGLPSMGSHRVGHDWSDLALSTMHKSESEVAQSCPTFCDPMDCSLSGSSIHGIFQARVLEWVAISKDSLFIKRKQSLHEFQRKHRASSTHCHDRTVLAVTVSDSPKKQLQFYRWVSRVKLQF